MSETSLPVRFFESQGWTDIELHQEPSEVHVDDEIFTPKPFWRGHAPGSDMWRTIPPIDSNTVREAMMGMNPDEYVAFVILVCKKLGVEDHWELPQAVSRALQLTLEPTTLAELICEVRNIP